MNLADVIRQFIVGFITGLFEEPDIEELKPERIQFWIELISNAWQREGDGVALLRTIVCDDAEAAGELAEKLAGELGRHGYRPDELDVVANVVSLRLSTASVGHLTECDYAVAALIDTML